MVDFMYYGEVNVSTEQLPQVLKTAEMLKIKGLAEMPDASAVSKSESKTIDHSDMAQGSSVGQQHPGSLSGGQTSESLWATESQQQQAQHQQQQYHQLQQQQQQAQQQQVLRRTPSPSTGMSPAARRKRLRKTSTGSGSLSTERLQSGVDEHGNNDGSNATNVVSHMQHMQQQVDTMSYSTTHRVSHYYLFVPIITYSDACCYFRFYFDVLFKGVG